LDEICKKLTKFSEMNNLSQNTSLLICQKLTDLLNYLPIAKSQNENYQRKKCLKITYELTDIILTNLIAEPVNYMNPLKSLTNLAIAHMQRGNRKAGRNAINHALFLSPSNTLIKSGFRVLKCVPFFFPNLPTVIIWKCMLNVYDVMLSHR